MSENKFVKLKNRGLLKISGPDRYSFLQGLITNDVEKLQTQPSLYACLLTPNGKFLFDFILFERNDTIHIDCEGGDRAAALVQKLTMYKLRANVTIEMDPDIAVFSILDEENQSPLTAGLIPDPRHEKMGYRTYTKPHNSAEINFDAWDEQRIRLSIPDGSRDMIPEKSTLLECNIDRLHGISWDKGCYMGQELTARMNYRALIKKSLQAIDFKHENPPTSGEALTLNNKVIGDMRSSCGSIGLAMLRHEYLDNKEELPFKLLSSDVR